MNIGPKTSALQACQTPAVTVQSTPLNYRRQRWFAKFLPQGLDSARYRACGNAVTVNVLYWLGLRIMCVDRMFADSSA